MSLTIIADNFTNFAISRIASGQAGGALQPTDTVFSVNQGDGLLFPIATPFLLVLGPDTINPEIVKVTGINGDTLAVIRAQESTTAQEWAITTTVQQTITAGNMANLWTTLKNVYGAIPNLALGVQDNPTSGDVQLIPHQPSQGVARGMQLGGVDATGAYHVGLTITSDGIVQGLAAVANVINIGSESAPTILVKASPVGYATTPTVEIIDDGTFILRGLSQGGEVDYLNITPGSSTAFVSYTLGPLSIYNNQLYAGATLSLTTATINPAAPTAAPATGTALGIGAYKYVVTFQNQNIGETLAGAQASVTTTSGNQAVALSAIPTGPYGTVARRIYRTLVGGAIFHLVTTINDNAATTYTDTTPDATISSTAVPPTISTFAGVFQILNPSNAPQLTLGSDGSITSLGNLTLNGKTSLDNGKITSDGAGDLTFGAAIINFTAQDSQFNTDLAFAPLVAAPAAPTLALATGTALGIGAYQYMITYTKTAGFWGETNGSASASITTTSGNQAVTVTLPTNPRGIGGRRIYRTTVGGSVFKLVATINDNTTTSYTDTVTDASLSTGIPLANSFGGVLRITDTSGVAHITLSPSGAIVATGALSVDNGAISSDGNGNLTVTSLIGSASKVGGHTITVGPTAPSSPALYDVWIKTSF